MGSNKVNIGYLIVLLGLKIENKKGISNEEAAIDPNIYHISITNLKFIAIIYDMTPIIKRASL